MRFNLLMLACDIPLCLSGKVKIKTVKVECVSQHVVYQFVVGVYIYASLDAVLAICSFCFRFASICHLATFQTVVMSLYPMAKVIQILFLTNKSLVFFRKILTKRSFYESVCLYIFFC